MASTREIIFVNTQCTLDTHIFMFDDIFTFIPIIATSWKRCPKPLLCYRTCSHQNDWVYFPNVFNYVKSKSNNFYPGQFGYCRCLCLPVRVFLCVCVRLYMHQPQVCPREILPPDGTRTTKFRKRCITHWLRSYSFWGWLTLTFKVNFTLKEDISPFLSLSTRSFVEVMISKFE